jgi:hypothetical protein
VTEAFEFIVVPNPGSSDSARGFLAPRPPSGGGTGHVLPYKPRPPGGGGVGTTIDLSGLSEYVGRLAPDEPIMIELPSLDEGHVPTARGLAAQYGRHVLLLGPIDIS